MHEDKLPRRQTSFAPHLRLQGWWAWGMLLCAACSNFDREDRIEDLRILAVRADPPEILYSPLYALTTPESRVPGLPLESVRMELEVYAFEPRGGLVRTNVNLCPAGEAGCIDFDVDEFLEKNANVSRAELEAVYRPTTVENEPAPQILDPSGRIPDLKWQFDFTPAVIDSLVPKTAEGLPSLSIFPTFPRLAIDVESPDHDAVVRETAFKRISTGVDLWDPALPADFRAGIASGLGIQLCETSAADEDFV